MIPVLIPFKTGHKLTSKVIGGIVSQIGETEIFPNSLPVLQHDKSKRKNETQCKCRNILIEAVSKSKKYKYFFMMDNDIELCGNNIMYEAIQGLQKDNIGIVYVKGEDFAIGHNSVCCFAARFETFDTVQFRNIHDNGCICNTFQNDVLNAGWDIMELNKNIIHNRSINL